MEVAEDLPEAEEENGYENMREVERVILLKVVDKKWMDHRCHGSAETGYRARAYAQRDPVIEYQIEGYEMFEEMIRSIQGRPYLCCIVLKLRKTCPDGRGSPACQGNFWSNGK